MGAYIDDLGRSAPENWLVQLGAGLFYLVIAGGAQWVLRISPELVDPGWRLTVYAIAAGLAAFGAFGVGKGLSTRLRRRRFEAARAAGDPGDWLIDHGWTPGSARSELILASSARDYFITSALVTFFAMIGGYGLSIVAFDYELNAIQIMTSVGFLGLSITLGIIFVRSRLAGGGAVTLRWDAGRPLRPGARWEAAIETSRAVSSASARLRHVVEYGKWKVPRYRGRTLTYVFERYEASAVPVELMLVQTPGAGTKVTLRADIPIDAQGTQLTKTPLRYWELLVEGSGFYAAFRIPIY